MKFYAFILILLLVSCTSVHSRQDQIVFVHGAHFTAESFQDLIYGKENFHAVDLPNERENALKVTLNDYALKVCDYLNQLKSPSILIGHSQGGAVINQSFGICPGMIRSLVYIGATIPMDGEKPFELLRPQDDEFYFKAIVEDKESGLFEIKSIENFINGFAQDATAQEKKIIESLSHAEPVAPSQTKVSFSLEKFRKVPKYVIITLNDRIITAETQKLYARRLPDANVKLISSGHLPMITATEELQELLMTILVDLQ